MPVGGRPVVHDPDALLVTEHLLRSEVIGEDGLEPGPPLGERPVEQGLAPGPEAVEDTGDERDRLAGLGHAVLAPEPAEHRLEREGAPVGADGDHLGVQDDVAAGRRKEGLDHLGEGVGHLLEPARPASADVADAVELDPGTVVLVFYRDRAIVRELLQDRPLLGEHQANRPERHDGDRPERRRPLPGEEGDLAQVVLHLLGVFDQRRIDVEGERDRVAHRPLTDPDPELGEDEPGEIAGLEWGHRPEALPEEAHLRLLGLGPGGRRDANQEDMDLGERHGIGEERGLLPPLEEALDREPRIAGLVHEPDDVGALSARDIRDRLVEEVRADPQLLGGPVREDPALDEPDEDRELGLPEPGKERGEKVAHLEPARDRLEPFADEGEVGELHLDHHRRGDRLLESHREAEIGGEETERLLDRRPGPLGSIVGLREVGEHHGGEVPGERAEELGRLLVRKVPALRADPALQHRRVGSLLEHPRAVVRLEHQRVTASEAFADPVRDDARVRAVPETGPVDLDCVPAGLAGVVR
ncbi:hypothetical protein DSECCO2_476740 [anaerobic digester metagenome]